MRWRFALGVITGVGLTAAVLASLQGGGGGVPAVGHVADCDGAALWLFAPSDAASSRAIDEATGGGGYSHALLETCELGADGEPLAIECRVGEGVVRVPLEDALARYEGRPWARVVFTGGDGRELYGCARARVGSRYDAMDVVVEHGLTDHTGITCSALVGECLPSALRARVLATPATGPLAALNTRLITANRLADAFAVRQGETIRV